jgi:hypothetical protein
MKLDKLISTAGIAVALNISGCAPEPDPTTLNCNEIKAKLNEVVSNNSVVCPGEACVTIQGSKSPRYTGKGREALMKAAENKKCQ